MVPSLNSCHCAPGAGSDFWMYRKLSESEVQTQGSFTRSGGSFCLFRNLKMVGLGSEPELTVTEGWWRSLRQRGSSTSLSLRINTLLASLSTKQQVLIWSIDQKRRVASDMCSQCSDLAIFFSLAVQLVRSYLHFADIFYGTGKEHNKWSGPVSTCLHSVVRMTNQRTGKFWPKHL